MYRIIILTFYVWVRNMVTLREDLRLRVFENRVLRIFGPNRDEVTGVEKTTGGV
jgi:hypothetical protein